MSAVKNETRLVLRVISGYVGTSEVTVRMRRCLFIMTLELMNQYSQHSATSHFLSKYVYLELSGKLVAQNLTATTTHLGQAVALSYDFHSKHPVSAVLRI